MYSKQKGRCVIFCINWKHPTILNGQKKYLYVGKAFVPYKDGVWHTDEAMIKLISIPLLSQGEIRFNGYPFPKIKDNPPYLEGELYGKVHLFGEEEVYAGTIKSFGNCGQEEPRYQIILHYVPIQVAKSGHGGIKLSLREVTP